MLLPWHVPVLRCQTHPIETQTVTKAGIRMEASDIGITAIRADVDLKADTSHAGVVTVGLAVSSLSFLVRAQVKGTGPARINTSPPLSPHARCEPLCYAGTALPDAPLPLSSLSSKFLTP